MIQSVRDAYEVYLRRSDLKPNSVSVKRKALGYFLELFNDRPVDKVTLADAEDFKVWLAKDRSKSTANTYLSSFVPFWKWLHSHGTIPVNPFGTVKTYKTEEKPKKYFTVEDLTMMARAFPLEWRVRLALGLQGCRRGMVMNLLASEIHIDGKTPHIELSSKTKTDTTWPWGNKNSKVQYIGLPEVMQVGYEIVNIHQDIRRLMTQIPSNQPYLCLKPAQYKRMIAKQQEGSLTQDDINDPCRSFNRKFMLRQKWAGVKEPKRFHELRAAFITSMIKAEGIRAAQQAVGHASVTTTACYDRTGTMEILERSNKVTSSAFSKTTTDG